MSNAFRDYFVFGRFHLQELTRVGYCFVPDIAMSMSAIRSTARLGELGCILRAYDVFAIRAQHISVNVEDIGNLPDRLSLIDEPASLLVIDI